MNKLATLIANGEITIQELANATDLIERAQLVTNGIEACKKTLAFHFGETQISCYQYMDSAGEYEAWGTVDTSGLFICYTNWGGNHEIGRCDLTNFMEVFLAFEKNEFSSDLKRFLKWQIEKATK